MTTRYVRPPFIWHGDTIGDPQAPAFIFISDTKQVRLADVLRMGLHHLDRPGRVKVVDQIVLALEKNLLHQVDKQALLDYIRDNIPPSMWRPGAWDKGAS